MTYQSRDRVRYKSTWIGTYYDLPSMNPHSTSKANPYERTIDVIGDYGVDHTFDHYEMNYIPCRMYGRTGYYLVDGYFLPKSVVSPTGSLRVTSDVAVSACARTNPSRPSQSLPNVIWELHDTLRLFRVMGRNLLQQGANFYLSVQLGWKPLIGDILTTLHFHDQVLARQEELFRLQQNRAMRRRVDLGHDTFGTSGGSTQLMSSPLNVWSSNWKLMTDVHYWAVVKWKPSSYFDGLSSRQKADKFYRLLNGYDPSQLTLELWESLPWSWLADWGLNLSNWLIANNNSVATLAHAVNVMVERRTTKWFFGVNPITEVEDFRTVPPIPRLYRYDKFRRLAYPNFTAQIPFLSGRQLSIIGSLVISRLRLNL